MGQRQDEMAVLTVWCDSGYIYNKVSHSCHFSLPFLGIGGEEENETVTVTVTLSALSSQARTSTNKKRCFLRHNSMFLAPQNCELGFLT